MSGGVYGLFDLLEAEAIDTLTAEELHEALGLPVGEDDESVDPALRWASEPGVVVIDGRDRSDFQASHVPGALCMPYFDLYFEWRSERYVDLARRVVASGRHVVCYANTGGSDGMGAGRCMRLCNFFFECWKVPVDRMHRLKGGYVTWKKKDLPVSSSDAELLPPPPRYRALSKEEEDVDDGASVATTATTSFARGFEAALAPLPLKARVARASAAAAAADDGRGRRAAYVVSPKRGAKVRATEALDSALVAELPRFLRVAATVADAPAATRLLVEGPWGRGFVSTKCLFGPLALEPAPPPELPPAPPPQPDDRAAPPPPPPAAGRGEY